MTKTAVVMNPHARGGSLVAILPLVVVVGLNMMLVLVASSAPPAVPGNRLGQILFWMQSPEHPGFWAFFYLLSVILIGALFAVWLIDRERQDRKARMGFSIALAASGSAMLLVGLFFAAARFVAESNGNRATAYYLVVGGGLLLAGVVIRR